MMKIQENVAISSLTTMRLGGKARFVIEVETPKDIQEAYVFAEEKGLPVWVMGGGANTIGRDEGFAGVIILNRLKGIFIEIGEEQRDIDDINPADLDGRGEAIFMAMAGEVWDDLVEATCKYGFSGIEAMSKIPGTVGAAPVQNIGAYGQDVSQVIESVEAYDTKTKQIVTLEKAEMGMGYRRTRFNTGKDAGRFVIMTVKLRLKRGGLQPPFYNSLQRYIDARQETDFSPQNIRKMVSEIREDKLPDPEKVASAGSFFKNVYLDEAGADVAEEKGIPIWRNKDGSGKINSGWLIESCGFKGKELYGFKVSEKAALVLINENAHSYADLNRARSTIREAVRKKFGYELEQEPVEIKNGEQK